MPVSRRRIVDVYTTTKILFSWTLSAARLFSYILLLLLRTRRRPYCVHTGPRRGEGYRGVKREDEGRRENEKTKKKKNNNNNLNYNLASNGFYA